MDEYKIGDVVFSKSGSPRLTVEETYKANEALMVKVVWFRGVESGIWVSIFPSQSLTTKETYVQS